MSLFHQVISEEKLREGTQYKSIVSFGPCTEDGHSILHIHIYQSIFVWHTKTMKESMRTQGCTTEVVALEGKSRAHIRKHCKERAGNRMTQVRNSDIGHNVLKRQTTLMLWQEHSGTKEHVLGLGAGVDIAVQDLHEVNYVLMVRWWILSFLKYYGSKTGAEKRTIRHVRGVNGVVWAVQENTRKYTSGEFRREALWYVRQLTLDHSNVSPKCGRRRSGTCSLENTVREGNKGPRGTVEMLRLGKLCGEMMA